MDKILNMIIGNPLTGVPGAIGVCAMVGPALGALGAALTKIGSGAPFWTVVTDLFSDPHVAMLATSAGLVASRDHNK